MSFVDAHDFPVGLVLRVLDVPESTYHDWRARRQSPSRRELDYAALLEAIVKVGAEQPRQVGHPDRGEREDRPGTDLVAENARVARENRMRKPEGQRGFAVLPRRWVVERTLAWLTAHRRLARDYERLPEHSEAWVKWAMIGLSGRPPPSTVAGTSASARSPGTTVPAAHRGTSSVLAPEPSFPVLKIEPVRTAPNRPPGPRFVGRSQDLIANRTRRA